MASVRANASTTKPSPPSWFTLIFNSLCCIAVGLIVPLYGFRALTNWPVTVEALFSCALSEWNRQKGLRRLKVLDKRRLLGDAEKGVGRTKYMASVVGYREEPGLFQRCLESYKPAGVDTFLIGIDGNGPDDMEMVRVVERVYPGAAVVAIDEPFAFVALRCVEAHAFGSSYKPKSLNERLDNLKQLPEEILSEAKDMAMRVVFQKAKSILQRYDVLERPHGSSGMRVICFHQPHVCKKDIMFTNLVISMILRNASHGELEFIWTSDSDTIVMPDTLEKAIESMALDPKIGGSSVTLGIHNAHDNWLTNLGAAVYWSEMAITRSQNGAVDAVDCQPGPCAAFRLTALEDILFDWYTQTSLGVRTVVNEDRHLTTLLLLQNYKVTFLSSALALTDTPTTLVRWVLQQLRWARAAHIERFQYPKVYAIHGPIPFINALIRHYGPLCVGLYTARYIYDGRTPFLYSWWDMLLRCVLFTLYNAAVHPTRLRNAGVGLGALMIGQAFYQIPLPGLILWSSITALEGGWGTEMRAPGQTGANKPKREGWDNLGALAAMTLWMMMVAAAAARYFVSRLAPQFVVLSMEMSALAVALAMAWTLLGGSFGRPAALRRPSSSSQLIGEKLVS